MFGPTSPIGQSSNRPFGSPSVFGQNSNAGSNPFTPKPSGSTTPFGSPTGGSVFGGTQHSKLGSLSPPAFGTSKAAFGAPSAPPFGSSSTQFGGSGFGGFASSPSQSNLFGSPFQKTQTTFGSSTFGSSTAIGAPSQNASGAASSAAFGQLTTSPFGAANTSAFGSSSTSPFGSTTAPAFGFGTGSAFGAANTVEASSTSVFGLSNMSAFGAPRTHAFDASSTTRFGFCTTSTTPTSGQSTSATGSSTAPTIFGIKISSGAQPTTATFGTTGVGRSVFGSQRRGSRVSAYTATAEVDVSSGKLQSISAMHINKDKSHEELRCEDYQLGDKGGIGVGGFTFQSNSFGPSPKLFQPSVNPFNSSTASTPFAPRTSFTPSVTQISSNQIFPQTSSAFNSSPFNILPSAHSFTTSPSASFGFITASIPASGPSSSPSPFMPSKATGFEPLPSTLNYTSALGTSPGFSSVNTQSSPIFQSVAPLPQSTSFVPSIVPSICQPNILSAPSTGSQLWANLCSSTSSLLPTCNLAGLSQTMPTQTAQTIGAFANTKIPQSSAALEGLTESGGTTGVLHQSTFSLPSATQNTVAEQPVPNVSPFGALPATPQLSIGHHLSAPPIRYGISSIPVLDKRAAPVRVSSLLTSRHLSQRRIRLPARKYDPKSDGPKVPFFSKDKELPTAPKAGAVFVPRENPRALVVLPAEQWPQRSNTEKMPPMVHASLQGYKNDHSGENSIDKERSSPTESTHEHKEHLADVEALMPWLSHSDYYTKPQIPELAAKEMAEPGFCFHVKNFVVGRHGYGSIKFLGETDVRQLDLDSHIKFNNREVIVYMDESEKPLVGEGLNKAAEVTLLNIKCIDKTGNQYINGPKVDRYREMLIKKATEQGAEFVSYDPVEGEWKFRVQHFSRYAF